jgi:hypothetical protein
MNGFPLFAKPAGPPLRSGRSYATLTPRGSLDCIAAARTAICVSFTFALAFGPSLPALRCAPTCGSLKGLFVRQSLCERTNQTLLRKEPYMATKQKSTNKPVEEVRIGSVKAAIWKNETESGPCFNVTFQRIYRDDEKGWRSTDSFGRDDLLVLAKVADQAHGRIIALSQQQQPSQKQTK